MPLTSQTPILGDSCHAAAISGVPAYPTTPVPNAGPLSTSRRNQLVRRAADRAAQQSDMNEAAKIQNRVRSLAESIPLSKSQIARALDLPAPTFNEALRVGNKRRKLEWWQQVERDLLTLEPVLRAEAEREARRREEAHAAHLEAEKLRIAQSNRTVKEAAARAAQECRELAATAGLSTQVPNFPQGTHYDEPGAWLRDMARRHRKHPDAVHGGTVLNVGCG